MAIKTILVQDHGVGRQRIRSFLEHEQEIAIVAEVRNGKEALEICAKIIPDIVLMDMNMPITSNLEDTTILLKLFPKLKILIFSIPDHANPLIDLLNSGASGYLHKNASKDEWVFAIKKVASEESYISSELIFPILENCKNNSGKIISKEPGILLSQGEIEILELIAEGYTNREMATKLFISVRTVESRRKKLLEKTDTTNTATLIKFAIRTGLIK